MHDVPSQRRLWPFTSLALLALAPTLAPTLASAQETPHEATNDASDTTSAVPSAPPADESAPPAAPTATVTALQPEETPAKTKSDENDRNVEKDEQDEQDEQDEPPWYEKLRIRGYAQLRFNRLFVTEDDFGNPLGDPATADDNSFSIRRARLVVSGEVASFLDVYLQADFAGEDAKMRDWYGDLYLTRDKQLRLRLGQSKVPYGFENMQSSSNRAPLDRSDALNTAIPGERDVGVFAYWEPVAARELYKHLTDSGLKGSGDYGVVALGVYNGQGLNVLDENENRHVVARVNYPFRIGRQIVEAGVAGYIGKFTVETDPGITGGDSVRDMRAGASLVVYPQPLGFQAEYNIGKGPELVGDTIQAEPLHGGYAMVLVKIGDFVPYVRGAYYDGAYKSFTNAPSAESTELVIGSEWHVGDALELTLEVDHAKRTIEDETLWGTMIRAQAQINY